MRETEGSCACSSVRIDMLYEIKWFIHQIHLKRFMESVQYIWKVFNSEQSP